MTMLTQEPASEGQIKQLSRVAADAAEGAVKDYESFSKDGAQRVHGNSGFAVRIRKATILALAELSACHRYNDEEALFILGTDFITPEEVTKAHPSVIYDDRHLAFLAETMPRKEDLQWCKDNGYAVMPAPPEPITLLSVQALKDDYFCREHGSGWYENQKFASNDKTRRGWLAVRKKPVRNWRSKNWAEQKKLLSGVEDVPNVAEMAWFITTYFEVRDVRLFETVLVRTRSVCSDGCHVDVGNFGQGGLHIDERWGGNRTRKVSVSSARKF